MTTNFFKQFEGYDLHIYDTIIAFLIIVSNMARKAKPM